MSTAAPSTSNQLTEEYREDSPSDGRRDDFRIQLVAGSDASSDDLYPLLRQRLLSLSRFFAGVCLLVCFVTPLISAVAMSYTRYATHAPSMVQAVFYQQSWRVVAIVIQFCVAVVLQWTPPSSIRGLRRLELMLLGSIVLIAYPSSSPTICLLLTVYGALVPNTPRRSAVVISIVAACPIVFVALTAYRIRHVDPTLGLVSLVETTAVNAISAAIAIYASSRIESSRRQAAEARKLGQYILKERLGVGGMGEVYRAQHQLLRRPCAVKVIHPERAGDPRQLQRFEREVQTTATLTHPNTIQIFDYGHAVDGTFYYVMEYLPGLTLEELVLRDGPLAPAKAIHFLRQVCGSLREAHALGLIHRDIKPGNVMVCVRGGVADVVKVLDFGLVMQSAEEKDGEKVTQEGVITGTPAYLSPEQAGGHDVLDARSDIYSVGALAYFLLVGEPPFTGRSRMKILAAHMYEAPTPISTHRNDVPGDLERVVLLCLEKDPAKRPQDVSTLDGMLARCQASSQSA